MTEPNKISDFKRKSVSTAFWTMTEIGSRNVLRLVSNLILTRLLFPEAFGMMALVMAYLSAMTMVSDAGINASILQNRRGDEPRFLDTAWTIQVIRGAGLWVVTLGLAWPMAALYQEPLLAPLLIVSALSLIVSGLTPSKVFSAQRHMAIRRMALLEVGAQVISLILLAGLAWWMQSVWALGIGTVLAAIIRIGGFWLFLPGRANRFCFDREVARELFTFGKYIFFNSAITFFYKSGDKAILGLYLDLGTIGIYMIGAQLAMLSQEVVDIVSRRLVIPTYRQSLEPGSAISRQSILKTRRLIGLGGTLVSLSMALLGPWIIETLYDPRYHLAAPVLVLMAASAIPVMTQSYVVPMLLAHGDSRRCLHIMLLTTSLQILFLFVGLNLAGLFGAVVAQGLATLCSIPLRRYYSARINGQDWVQDFLMTGMGLLIGSLCIWFHFDLFMELLNS